MEGKIKLSYAFETCKKRLSLTDVACRCKLKFCGSHIHAEDHNCTYDYKKDGRQYLSTTLHHVQQKKIEVI